MAQVVMTVECNQEHRRTLEKHIRQEMAMGAVPVQSAAEALRYMTTGAAPQPDVILLDIGMDTSSLEVVRALRSLRNDVQIIVLAGHSAVDTAMQALTCGAADFLLKPFHAAQLTSAIRNALIRRDLQMEARHAWMGERISLDDFKAESSALSATLFLARKLAETDAPLVLEGAPGTGRELFARAIHGSSSRCDAPFVAINASVFMGEEAIMRLFGDGQRRGVLNKVQGGSVLLRNVDVLPEAARRRLLELAKDGAPIHPARPEERFSGRMMFAVNDAARRSSSNEKREVGNLFSRLNALPVSIPHLRDMPEDIPFLALLLCRRYAALEGKAVMGISAAAAQMLREISWPGNVEQLSQGIFNAVMCCESNELQVEDFRYLFRSQGATVAHLARAETKPAAMDGGDGVLHCTDGRGNIKRLQEMEQEMIRYALERYSGHMSEVARHLGIGRSTLYRKISSMDGKE